MNTIKHSDAPQQEKGPEQIVHHKFKSPDHLKAYLANCLREHTVPLFNGPKDYQMLLEAGVLDPAVTAVRLQNPESMDQYYFVSEGGKLEGCSDLNAHAGKPGVFGFAELIVPGQRFEIEAWKPE